MSDSTRNLLATVAAILAGVGLGLGVGAIIASSHTADEANRKATAAARQAAAATAQADRATFTADLATSQASTLAAARKAAIHAACEDTNRRNQTTLRTLAAIYRHVPPTPRRERAQLKANRTATILLINAILPHRGC